MAETENKKKKTAEKGGKPQAKTPSDAKGKARAAAENGSSKRNTAAEKKTAEGKKPTAKKAVGSTKPRKPTPPPTILPPPSKEAKRSNTGGKKKPNVKNTLQMTAKGIDAAPIPKAKLRVAFLGGLHEIGKNMCMIEYGHDILIVDAGIAFPDEEMPGIDLVIPDISYLVENKSRVRGILLTHGHEDHIGAVPYVLRDLSVPVYGTALTLGILGHKLDEFKLPKKPDLRRVNAGDVLSLGGFSVELIHVNHSIPDALAFAIRTPHGIVFHTGDYKLDVSPIDGQMMDIGRIAEIGREGVLLLLGESTNAERVGFTPSERRVGGSLEHLFMKYPDRRMVIATFSSNVHRVQQIMDASARHGRRVVVFGRSMTNVVGAAVELGYITVPEGTIIQPGEMKRFKPEELTILTTGSQGEPMSALSRMAFGEHDRVTLTSRDVVVLSAKAIPGNEKLVGKIINALVGAGIRVENDDSIEDIHVSGHACSEELKLMIALTRPRYVMPIHGEVRHLFAHKEIAEFMGVAAENIFLGENGRVLELDRHSAGWAGSIPAGRVLVDGAGVGDVGASVLRDRILLSEDGLIAVVATVDRHEGLLMSGPEVVSRGFVYVKESEALLDEVRLYAANTLVELLDRNVKDFNHLKTTLRDELSRMLYKRTGRRPMVLPILLDL